MKRILILLICSLNWSIAQKNSILPGDDYAFLLRESLERTHKWVQASDKVFDQRKIDPKHVQPFRDWLVEVRRVMTDKPTIQAERKIWVESIRSLYMQRIELLKSKPVKMNSFQVSIRGLVRDPQSITINAGRPSISLRFAPLSLTMSISLSIWSADSIFAGHEDSASASNA